jgi:RNA-dependent RNA polymerase
LESSNSIARKYGRPEHFLRIAVRNEDGSLLERSSNAIVESRFKRLFRDGFDLGGRRWEFLAWSASALKSGACFFVSPFEIDGVLHTPEVIHRDIGDFAGDQVTHRHSKLTLD